jgi:hypothetical protein
MTATVLEREVLWEARGGEGGSPEEDWLRAEEILMDSQS